MAIHLTSRGHARAEETAQQDLACLTHSHGKVREFFLRTACTSLDRILFAVGDGHGNTMLVSVAWVGFRTKAQATGQFGDEVLDTVADIAVYLPDIEQAER